MYNINFDYQYRYIEYATFIVRFSVLGYSFHRGCVGNPLILCIVVFYAWSCIADYIQYKLRRRRRSRRSTATAARGSSIYDICIYIYIYIYVYMDYLSLSLSMYIYIYIERERNIDIERERDTSHTLHIYCNISLYT